MARKKTQELLPDPGDAFLMPLSDGRFGVCRVIRHSSSDEAKFQGAVQALVAASSWIGSEAPDANNPDLRPILTLMHHSWQHRPGMIWVPGPPPATFWKIGTITPATAESAMDYLSSSDWPWLPLQVLMQWRWDNEREAVERENDETRLLREQASEAGAQRYQEYLAGLTLEALRKKRRFTGWKGYVPDPALAACRRIFRETIDAIVALGPDPPVRPLLRILRSCIEQLNDLDDEHHHFIATIEREEICEEFGEIVYASGLTKQMDLADRWRDW